MIHDSVVVAKWFGWKVLIEEVFPGLHAEALLEVLEGAVGVHHVHLIY